VESKIIMKRFDFEIITVNSRGEKSNTRRGNARQKIETLGNDVNLEMVYIPEGSFIMGASDAEKGSRISEHLQHEVKVPAFFMAKYPITQAQWRRITSLPKIKRNLEPDPSNFKGDNHPVEQISWYDAVEFCDRLSKYTRVEYRLPSEAEWEYACRAGTTTPFYFGETITGELANYNASAVFAEESEGEYRQITTEVGQFKPNSFGLYDMHGNLWEWCLDSWHDNYEEAPFDNSPGLKKLNANDNHSQVLRGGSWNNNPENCRSAYRNNNNRDNDNNNNGFRLVCDVARRTQ